MFLGTTMFCGKYAFMPPVTDIKNFNSISICDGTYDHLFLSSNTDETIDNINDDWKYETKLNAKFETDLEGGNIGFSLKNTDTIVIKTREKNDFEWKTIYTVPINKKEDFNFILNYPYSPNNSDNEYMLLSTINGIENSYVTTECTTKFGGIFIVDKDNIYGTEFNLDNSDTTQNINPTVIELLNNKYPTVYTNSDANYTSGSTSGCFLKIDCDNNTIDSYGSVKYRKDIMQWLCNNRAKILKLHDGRIYLIKITGKPTDTCDGHQDLRKISFEWVEVGDINSAKDLYLNNLSDISSEWW